MKGIEKATMVIAKICEIVHWIGVVGMAILAVCAISAQKWVDQMLAVAAKEPGAVLNTYGFEVEIANGSEVINATTVALYAVGAIMILGLMAMVFRNIYLILKKSENTTPFQKDNVRMVREIGIFSISIPVLGLILNGIFRLIVGPEALEASISMDGVFYGLVILCLTQFFAHGVELEQDISGLL